VTRRFASRTLGAVAVVTAVITAGVLALTLGGSGETAASSQTAPPASSDGVTLASDSNPLASSISMTQQQLRDEPNNWLAWASLGAAYVQQGRATADPSYYPKAQRALERSLALDSKGNFVAMVGMGTLLAARHEFSGALQWSRRALQIDPQSAAAYSVMTDALDELGRYDQAIAAVQHAVDLSPGVSTFSRVSYVRELHGDRTGAVIAMRQALADAVNPQDVAFCDYYLGELGFGAGDLSAAMQSYAAGLRAVPMSPMLLEGRAKVEAARGQVSAAVRDYTTVVETLPLPQYAVEFGDYLTSLHRTADAKKQYALVAIEDRLFRANGVNNDLDITLFEAEHGNAAAAVKAGRAEWSRRHSIIVADAYGWALHRAGDDVAALRYATFATSLGLRNATYYFHKGAIESGLGQTAAARRDLAHALQLNPYFSPLNAPVATALLRKAAR
jgi:tetratricopeptide (TPR) repeat protein